MQNKCQVSKFETCSYLRYKGIYGTRKVSGRSRNGPQASVVKGLVSAIQQINPFPLGNSIAFDRNYPSFEEMRSG